MPARQFLLWNIVGAVLWTDGVLLIGYLLAQQIFDLVGEKIDHYILPVVVLIVLISALPILLEMLRERKAKKNGTHTGPQASAAVGVVAAASIVGLAEAATHHEDDDDHERRRRPGSHRA
jgi:membrane-associated protein